MRPYSAIGANRGNKSFMLSFLSLVRRRLVAAWRLEQAGVATGGGGGGGGLRVSADDPFHLGCV
jgi:hypothetical protein